MRMVSDTPGSQGGRQSMMADRDSASESDSSSIDGGPIMMPPSPVTREQLQKRIESLQQANKVLRLELESFKLRVKSLVEENKTLKQQSVTIVSFCSPRGLGMSFPIVVCHSYNSQCSQKFLTRNKVRFYGMGRSEVALQHGVNFVVISFIDQSGP